MIPKKHFVSICLCDFGATLPLHADFAKAFGVNGKIRTEVPIILSKLFCDVTANQNNTKTLNVKISSTVIINLETNLPNI